MAKQALKNESTEGYSTEQNIEHTICRNGGHNLDLILPFEGFNFREVYAYCRSCGKLITVIPAARVPYPSSPEIEDQLPR